MTLAGAEFTSTIRLISSRDGVGYEMEAGGNSIVSLHIFSLSFQDSGQPVLETRNQLNRFIVQTTTLSRRVAINPVQPWTPRRNELVIDN